MREQHYDVDLGAAAERLDRGTAGVARRCDNDGRALATLQQHVVHQPRNELHGEVLEGERRSVEQFEHEQAGRQLDQRRGRRMTEGAVGLARHAGKIGFRNGGADEGLDHLDRDFGVGLAGEAANCCGIERRPGVGHIKSPISRQPRKHDLDKIERSGLAPG